ncbi:MAG: hypothetical protein AAGU75_02415 [Bacillota bacterium]
MAILCEGNLYPNFTIEEMANNLSKRDVKIQFNPEMNKHGMMIQEFRNWFFCYTSLVKGQGKGLPVNSWFRWPEFNEECGGDPNSCHPDGIATDFSLPGLTKNDALLFASVWQAICIKWGVIGGVSIYLRGAKAFMHFDSNNNPNRYASGYSDKFRINYFK